MPLGVYRNSGARVRLPIRKTLFRLAISRPRRLGVTCPCRRRTAAPLGANCRRRSTTRMVRKRRTDSLSLSCRSYSRSTAGLARTWMQEVVSLPLLPELEDQPPSAPVVGSSPPLHPGRPAPLAGARRAEPPLRPSTGDPRSATCRTSANRITSFSMPRQQRPERVKSALGYQRPRRGCKPTASAARQCPAASAGGRASRGPERAGLRGSPGGRRIAEAGREGRSPPDRRSRV